MKQTFFILGKLPGNNELREAAGWTAKGKGRRWNKYAQLKKSHTEDIVLQLYTKRIAKPKGRVWIGFEWIEPDARRDPDNIDGGGRKIILDALTPEVVSKKTGKIVKAGAGILEGDSQWYVAGFLKSFVTIDRDPTRSGVFVTLEDEI